MWSTGIVKKPWTCPACRSIVNSAVGPGELDHVGQEAARDRLAWLRLSILPRVREPRKDGRDALRRGEPRGLDHEEQLHDVLVDGVTAGLHEEEVGTSDRLAVAAVGLAVRERRELDLPELDRELLRDLRRQLGMRAAREHHQPLLGSERDRVAGVHLDPRDLGLEAGQRLLNRSAFHPAPPC